LFTRAAEVPTARILAADQPGAAFQHLPKGECSSAGERVSSNLMTGKILIVDDESSARLALTMLLRREGFQVTETHSGDSALELCHTFRPDLILLDIMMPGMNGFEVCRRIKATPETRLTPVVLITGLSATQDRIEGINAGADDFLSKPIDFSELLARARSLLRLKQFTDELENAEGVLFSLAESIEARDPYTRGHCERLADMSSRLAEKLGLPEDQIKALRRAGIVHDIGKIAVPDAILLKPGPLTPQETEIMRTHPVVGERICSPLRTFGLVLPIIRHHHERHDGSGYPDGLHGSQIPITAAILQLADVFDALTTNRPYRNASPPEIALQIMYEECARGWWNRELLDAFTEMFGKGYLIVAAKRAGQAAP
jgi:putative two-component system response regulator